MRAHIMCADGRLQWREMSNFRHAVAKMTAAGKLATDDADVKNTLGALEQRMGLVPYFEYDELKGRTGKKRYITEKLQGAGVHVPASA